MRIGSWARLMIAAALGSGFLTGCGNFWQAPSTTTTTTCTTNCSTATSGAFYILNNGTTPQVVGEKIVSGTLTSITGSPWPMPSAPYAMDIAPNGNFLVVSTIAGVYSYPLTNGVLGTGVQITQDQAYAVQIDATDSWLIEAIPTTGGVTFSAVSVNPSTGAYTGHAIPITFSNANAALQQGRMVISPDNSYIFCALGMGGAIVVPFNSSSPFPSTVSAKTIPVATAGGAALSVAVDPSTTPRLFYVGETLGNSAGTSGGLRAFTYASLATSTLVNATGSPIASGGLAPSFILPVSSPSYVYVANGVGNIAGFAVTASGSTYSLSAGSTTSISATPVGMALDSSGTFLLSVSSGGTPYFSPFTFDSTTTGTLDAQNTANTGASAIAIVAAP